MAWVALCSSLGSSMHPHPQPYGGVRRRTSLLQVFRVHNSTVHAGVTDVGPGVAPCAPCSDSGHSTRFVIEVMASRRRATWCRRESRKTFVPRARALQGI